MTSCCRSLSWRVSCLVVCPLTIQLCCLGNEKPTAYQWQNNSWGPLAHVTDALSQTTSHLRFCLPVTMVELRIANSSLAFKVSFTSSVRLSQLLPVFRCAVQLFCYAVQLCCYVVQLCCYANLARSELDVRGLRTKAHSNSRWRRLCYCCRSLLSMEPVETMQKIPSICF